MPSQSWFFYSVFATICFGVGLVHEQFKTLQRTVNRFAPLGIPSVVVDGFIGNETVTSANLAAEVSGGTPPGKTREAVAANALTLTAQLQNSVTQLESEGILMSTTASTPSETPTPIIPVVDRAIPPAPATRSRAWVWLVVGGALAAIGTVGLLLHRRYHAESIVLARRQTRSGRRRSAT